MIRLTLTPIDGEISLNGKIKRRESGKIYVEIFNANRWNSIIAMERYNIVFEINRIVYQLQHNALDFIKRYRLFDILINNPSYHYQEEENRLNCSRSVCRNSTLNDLNSEQIRAVDNIVTGDNFPLPYLLYGPPG